MEFSSYEIETKTAFKEKLKETVETNRKVVGSWKKIKEYHKE